MPLLVITSCFWFLSLNLLAISPVRPFPYEFIFELAQTHVVSCLLDILMREVVPANSPAMHNAQSAPYSPPHFHCGVCCWCDVSDMTHPACDDGVVVVLLL